MTKVVYWSGKVAPTDDFGTPIIDQFIDGRTKQGPWAIMTPYNFDKHGVGKLGLGFGQKYVCQSDGRWMKVEG